MCDAHILPNTTLAHPAPGFENTSVGATTTTLARVTTRLCLHGRSSPLHQQHTPPVAALFPLPLANGVCSSHYGAFTRLASPR